MPQPLHPAQPVHTVYGGAHRFRADVAPKLAEIARKAAETHAGGVAALATELAGPAGEEVHARVTARLATPAAVEDFRVDFEDGYGVRPDAEEDAAAATVAAELSRGAAAGLLPPGIGIRVKPLGGPTQARALRTLERVLERLDTVPAGFVVTLPKVTAAAQVARLGEVLATHEARLGLPRIPVEIMVETPDALLDADGRCPLRSFVAAGDGRVRGCHLGAYDLLSSLGVPGARQSLAHPACVHARTTLSLALAGTGVWLSDGAHLDLPLDPATIARAWRGHALAVTAALEVGIPQGWDLHPTQIVSRLLAVYALYAVDGAGAARRLGALLASASQAVHTGGAFDDAATGRGLLTFLQRGLTLGALPPAALAGLDADALRDTTFDALLAARVGT